MYTQHTRHGSIHLLLTTLQSFCQRTSVIHQTQTELFAAVPTTATTTKRKDCRIEGEMLMADSVLFIDHCNLLAAAAGTAKRQQMTLELLFL